ncbi:hypothetical protein COR50_20700 [Chitinophaga caeni]|uniref:Uncharacterized protein n=1 Tax=Chitinophaga caeni TaxID=2029983 RepID=A0A291QZT4_9BACT|nr:hypothetical protein [Chitinophaga caeni]ATL49402.1 hypothetical protein COR50_20700 [Chitinophaga caeni]
MKLATSIEFIKNLAQYDYNNHYYDFHNDYSCEKISYSDSILLIVFKSLIDGLFLSLKFTEVKITTVDFFNVKEIEGLTLDNLYRGRVELNGELIEVSENGRGYFYLEFYEGQKMEFWAKDIGIEQE